MNEQISIESLLVEVQRTKGPTQTNKGQHKLTQTNKDQCTQRVGCVGFEQYMNSPEPPCYTCRHALRRGPFRICMAGGLGYLKIGELVDCDKYQEVEDEQKDQSNH